MMESLFHEIVAGVSKYLSKSKMDPQELLQERINRAEAAMEKGQTAMEKAETAMEKAETAVEKAETAMEVATETLEKWKQENPGFSVTNECYLYYQKEVDKCYNALDKCYNALDKRYNALERKEEIYKELVKTYEKLIEKMPSANGVAVADVKELINQNKQLFDLIHHEQSSNSDSKRSSAGRNSTIQNKFREKLIARDKVCVISGNETVEACHIIPYRFPSDNSGIWCQKYNRFCFDRDEGISDVRNGILLSKCFHNRFEKYQFTIIFEENLYKIKVGAIPIPHLENGKVLSFPTGEDSNGNEWKDQWPAPEFLKWHNDNFDKNSFKLNTDGTIMHFDFDENDYRIKWLNEQLSTTDYEDPKLSIRAPKDSLEFMEQLQSL
ncbi:hypothetical protein BC833DRAFT_630956 [Globomyces pollinis-pini]|nr:hypothetical protein BC833DRAFT_630956 [Globomyces pollinis-pini]